MPQNKFRKTRALAIEEEDWEKYPRQRRVLLFRKCKGVDSRKCGFLPKCFKL